MEKHNTDDIFKKMLESPPPMRPDMDALEDMNRRLDAAKSNRKGGVWWWWPLLLLPFLLGTYLFYDKLQTAKQTINDLNIQLTELKATSTNNQYLIDTDSLTRRITIYQYDTIFNSIYQDVIIQRNIAAIPNTITRMEAGFNNFSSPNFAIKNFEAAFADKVNTFDDSSFKSSQLELLRNGKVLSLGQIGAVLENKVIANKSTDSKENRLHILTPSVEKIAFLDNRFQYEHPLPLSDHFLNLTTKSNNDINPLWYLIPTGFQASLNWSPIGLVNSPIGNNKVKAIGIIGELEFTKNTRMQIGLSYLRVPLSAESSDDLSTFPVVTPDAPSDILTEIYGDFNYLQVPITLKYVFQADKKWKPSIGVGMIARLPIKEQFRYEFVNNQGEEYKLTETLGNSVFNINNLRGTIGIEYNFYRNYTIQVEGFYNYQLGTPTNTYFNLRYGGLNMGLKYKF